MSGRSEPLLLDTNIVVHLIRDNEMGRRVDATFQIRNRPDRPLVSVVTVGDPATELAKIIESADNSLMDLDEAAF